MICLPRILAGPQLLVAPVLRVSRTRAAGNAKYLLNGERGSRRLQGSRENRHDPHQESREAGVDPDNGMPRLGRERHVKPDTGK